MKAPLRDYDSLFCTRVLEEVGCVFIIDAGRKHVDPSNNSVAVCVCVCARARLHMRCADVESTLRCSLARPVTLRNMFIGADRRLNGSQRGSQAPEARE